MSCSSASIRPRSGSPPRAHTGASCDSAKAWSHASPCSRDGHRFLAVGNRLRGVVRFECGDPEGLERHRHRREAGVAGALEARPAQVVTLLDEADPVRVVAGETEELRPHLRREGETVVEDGVVPLVGFADGEGDVPVDLEPSDQGDQQLAPVVIAGPAERGPEVAMLGVEPTAPLLSVGASERRGGGLDKSEEVIGVTGVHTRCVVELCRAVPTRTRAMCRAVGSGYRRRCRR